jgi:hypothetical protein
MIACGDTSLYIYIYILQWLGNILRMIAGGDTSLGQLNLL